MPLATLAELGWWEYLHRRVSAYFLCRQANQGSQI